MVMVFNATFNNISIIVAEETGVPGKITDLPQVCQMNKKSMKIPNR
jgi:hypothetical protein